jgi:hypothetical protein
MTNRATAVALVGSAALASLLAIGGCGHQEMGVRGTVKVNGQPLEQGTINFESVGAAQPIRGGAAVKDGVFTISAAEKGIAPGKYKVSVEGYHKTGRQVKDQQRGLVDEIVPIPIREATVDVTVTPENAQQLEIALTRAR